MILYDDNCINDGIGEYDRAITFLRKGELKLEALLSFYPFICPPHLSGTG